MPRTSSVRLRCTRSKEPITGERSIDSRSSMTLRSKKVLIRPIDLRVLTTNYQEFR